MGKVNRERIERIRNGEEPPISNVSEFSPEMGKEVLSEAQTIAEKRVAKAAKSWEKMSLPQQVKVACGLMRRAGLAQFRSQFMSGFPDDIRDLHKSGKSNEEITDYYLGCPAFVSFWKDLGFDENKFMSLLPKPEVIAETPASIDDLAESSKDNLKELTQKDNLGLWAKAKRWFVKSTDYVKTAPQKASGSYTGQLNKAIEAAVSKKIKYFLKKGAPLTLDRLMVGSEGLCKLGMTEPELRKIVTQKLHDAGYDADGHKLTEVH